jgi:hypothetical protein
MGQDNQVKRGSVIAMDGAAVPSEEMKVRSAVGMLRVRMSDSTGFGRSGIQDPDAIDHRIVICRSGSTMILLAMRFPSQIHP